MKDHLHENNPENHRCSGRDHHAVDCGCPSDPTQKPLVAIVGCPIEQAEALVALFYILGWRSTVVDRIDADIALTTRLTIIGELSLIPPEIVYPYSNSPTLALICRKQDFGKSDFAISRGCVVFNFPLEIDAIEDLVVALS